MLLVLMTIKKTTNEQRKHTGFFPQSTGEEKNRLNHRKFQILPNTPPPLNDNEQIPIAKHLVEDSTGYLFDWLIC